MYKVLNEDNTLVKEYPSPEIYKTMSEEEKENIQIFKKEIDRILSKKGLDRVSVNVSYDGLFLEKAFVLKYSDGYSYDYYYKEIRKITEHMENFSKTHNLNDFFMDSYIILE